MKVSKQVKSSSLLPWSPLPSALFLESQNTADLIRRFVIINLPRTSEIGDGTADNKKAIAKSLLTLAFQSFCLIFDNTSKLIYLLFL
ncbi:MAG: hypothetical protein F6J86_05345 [Symploca sp. SIO1B1]|nr:hypothetical protein [Symploca sp. SIO1B1]